MLNKRLTLIAYLTACLLLLNSGLSVAFAYNINSSNSDSNEGAQRILLCTSKGYQWVSIGELTPDTSSTPASFTLNHNCPFCLFNALTPDGITDTAFAFTGINPCYSVTHRINSSFTLQYNPAPSSDNLSRAPPTLR